MRIVPSRKEKGGKRSRSVHMRYSHPLFGQVHGLIVDWTFHHGIPSELHRYLWYDLDNRVPLDPYSVDDAFTCMLVVCRRVSSIDGSKCMFPGLEERIVEETFSRQSSAWRKMHQAWAALRFPSDEYRRWSSLLLGCARDCNDERKR